MQTNSHRPKNDTVVDFVVRKHPKGQTIRQLKDGTIKITIEVTQDEMDALVNKMIETT